MTAILTIPPPRLLTAREFAERHSGDRVELIDGIVTELPMPFSEHGLLCFQIAFALGNFVVPNDLGRLLTNDSFIRTRTDPDRVRGADVAYYSYERLPKGPMPPIPDVAPDLVVEVRSPSDHWPEVVAKAAEYLMAGVRVVVVVDAESETVLVHRLNQDTETLRRTDTLTLPDVLPGFGVSVDRLFS